MNHVTDHRPSGRFIIAVLIGLAFPVMSGTAGAFEVDRSPRCKATETTQLNRWPLRGSDMAGCDEKNRSPLGTALAATNSRNEGQEPTLNRWPYVFRPQEFESDRTLVVKQTQDQTIAPHRTEPDLNMWPLWPRS